MIRSVVGRVVALHVAPASVRRQHPRMERLLPLMVTVIEPPRSVSLGHVLSASPRSRADELTIASARFIPCSVAVAVVRLRPEDARKIPGVVCITFGLSIK